MKYHKFLVCFILSIALMVMTTLLISVPPCSAAGEGAVAAYGDNEWGQLGRGVGPQEFVPGEIIVKFKETASASRIKELVLQQKSDVLYTNSSLGFKRVKIPEGRSVSEMVETFQKNPLVEYSEPNYIDQLQATVDDPYFPYQWHLDNPVSGSIHMGQAWDLETGKPDVIVAVVDTGVAYENYGGYTQAPDLAQTKFVFPHDSVDGDGHPNDTNGHGTHVTGTIAQSTNNGIGVAGVAYGCSIMPIRSLGTGGGTHAQFADAFTWAADYGAKVINYSGGGPDSVTKENACEYAYERGVTICAASGNENGAVEYPAAYDQYCIAVGATRFDETRSDYSNYGPQLDVVAPGGDANVDQNGDGYPDGVLQQTYTATDNPASGFSYQFWQGTSMATPHVSGVAALYISITGISNPDAVRNQLQTTAHDLGAPGRDNYFGYGLIDAYRVLPSNPIPTTTTLSPTSKTAGDAAFTLTVNGTNFVNGLSKVRWNGTDRTTTYVSTTQLTAAITTADIAPAGAASVTVFNPAPGGGTSNAQTFTVNSASSTWYLAEGTTAWGFETYISIMNPNSSAVTANVTYMLTGAATRTETVPLPANSQTTLTEDHLVSLLGQTDFSTIVECSDKTKTIAVDRTMSWTGPGAASPEGHSSVGVNAPATTWYLPEGSAAWGFETWLLIQNPNGSQATCQVTYMIEGESPITVPHTVGANSRASFSMETDIGKKDASIKVTSDQPVIPERAMYRNNRREGHDSIGTTAPAQDYYLAEGATGYGSNFVTYVLVQNPQGSPTDVSLTYMTQSGQVPGSSFQMPPNSRKTVKINDQLLANTDVSTRVHGSQPIIAERAMYWDNGTGEACHDSIGMASPHDSFYLPDGQSSQGRETWTLVQNPGDTDVQVDITYMTPLGTGNVTKTETVPANSRKTFNMLEHSGTNGRAAIMVTSKSAGKKIMVERAMYWNNRGAGTDTIGGYGD